MEYEQDKWVLRKDTGEMVNLKGCIEIYKYTQNSYDDPHRIKFIYAKKSEEENIYIAFKDEKQRDNFHDHLIVLIKPLEIDPDTKPLTL